jgi:hypothetical protein
MDFPHRPYWGFRARQGVAFTGDTRAAKSDAAIAAQHATKIEQLPPQICVQAPSDGRYSDKNQ